jgi:acetyl esterase
MIGKTYLERGNPILVLARWDTKVPKTKRSVLIQRQDGSLVVRPFRGLRKIQEFPNA